MASVEQTTRDERIVELRRKMGYSARETVKQLAKENIFATEQTVCKVLKTYSDNARVNLQDTVLARMTEQVDFLDDLISRAKRKLIESGWDNNLVKTIILLLERQSKLLGLDKHRDHVNEDWMKEATEADLRRECERIGIPVPVQMSLV